MPILGAVAVGIIVIVLLYNPCLFGCPKFTTPPHFLKYENSAYGIKMQYPSDWRSFEGDIKSSIVASFYPKRDNADYIIVQIDNLTTSSTTNQYLNSLMRGDVASKDFPDIKFTINTTSSVVLAGHPGFFLAGTFRDPTSDALQEFTNIGTIIGDKEYSVIYYSPEQTYPVYSTIYSKMIKSFEVINTITGQNNTSPQQALSPYGNTFYGVTMKYPLNWRISPYFGGLVTFDSAEARLNHSIAEVRIIVDNYHGSFNLTSYLNYFIISLRNNTSYKDLHIIEYNTTSMLAGRPAYKLVFTATNPYLGIDYETMVTGTLIGSRIYSLYSVVFSDQYSNYLSTIQHMIDSFQVQNQTGPVIQYQNPKLGFSIGYPNNFTLSEMSSGVTFTPRSQEPYTRISVNVIENKSLQNVPLVSTMILNFEI